jgi:hypothetical protein
MPAAYSFVFHAFGSVAAAVVGLMQEGEIAGSAPGGNRPDDAGRNPFSDGPPGSSFIVCGVVSV